eukprot:GEMP01059575.1.p1 GENE.GEMP01059575.1~~GEMP01059575.1.p1  ORF type:complete len:263 (+),score=43.45 GEMP01059575.1:189-977(+)
MCHEFTMFFATGFFRHDFQPLSLDNQNIYGWHLYDWNNACNKLTRDEDCQRVIQECGFGQGEEPQCLGKRRSFTQLLHDGTTHDGNKWHTYYVCRHRTPVEGAEVLLYEAFREIKALWDVDGAHMTSENKCTEALAKENSFLLERRLVYDKGVLCTGFRNLDLLEIPPHLLVKQDAGDDHVAMTVVTRPEVPHLTRYAGDGPVMTVGAAFLLANTRRPVQKGVWSAIGCSCGEASHSECFCGAGTAASIDVLLRLVLVVLLL